jgi:dsRNA-specific ribonuclease
MLIGFPGVHDENSSGVGPSPSLQTWRIFGILHRPGPSCPGSDPSVFVNEREENLSNNESLEFLGDAVLGFVVSARIFQHYPELTEGELSKIKAYLVSAANLVLFAEGIHLGDFVRLSRGEEKTGGRSKRAIVVDAYEAIIGAMYMDGGVEAVSDFVSRQIDEFLNGLDLRQLTYMISNRRCRNTSTIRPPSLYRVVDEIGRTTGKHSWCR